MSVSPPILDVEPCETISADSSPCSTVNPTTVEEYLVITKRLSEKLRDVTVMNDKWQKYNEEREKYVDGLRRDFERTKKKLYAREKELSETKSREREFEKTVRDHQDTISSFTKLMDELDEKEGRERALVMRVGELEKEAESLRTGRAERIQENVTLLQQQLEVCIEDFKTEKQEKDKYRQEVHILRKKSMDTDSLLQDYQEKIALIKSLEFPTIPRDDGERYEHSRRKSSAYPRRPTNYKTVPKPSSWSYPSNFITFDEDIEADGIVNEGSQSDGAVADVGPTSGIPVKTLDELFPQLKLPIRSEVDSAVGLESVFTAENDEGELIRR